MVSPLAGRKDENVLEILLLGLRAPWFEEGAMEDSFIRPLYLPRDQILVEFNTYAHFPRSYTTRMKNYVVM